MATSSASVSRWTRWFVAAGAVWLVGWQAAALSGLPREARIALGLLGFVFHVLFGKAYALVPSYFDRELAFSLAPRIHLPLAILGVLGLAAAPLAGVPPLVGAAGALAWVAGVAVFLATILWTVRDNLTGADTGTGEHNAARRGVDRAANALVPVALAYLAVGSYGLLAPRVGLPVLLDGSLAREAHLLAAGAAAGFVFAVGFRLLPRFLVAEPPTWLVRVVLPAGALGPALIAVGLPSGPLLALGGVLEATAIVGFAAAYLALFRRSERRRVGFYGVGLGALAGVAAAALGLSFAFGGPRGAGVIAHFRLMLTGFLGLTIVGVTYQFYPPTVGQFPGAGDPLAYAVLGAVAGGLAVEVAGLLVRVQAAVPAGRALVLAGALGYAYLLVGLFVQRWRG
ncbi:MAG: hypothetical protein ABEJ31_11225 [Haloarculaceae archaeon]